MILTCPSCGTQYMVKDGAIPPEGRQVRCASCKHSWHQHPEQGPADELTAEQPIEVAAVATHEPEPEREPEPEPEYAEDEDESFAEATLIEPRSGPEAEERAYEEAALDAGEAPRASAGIQFDLGTRGSEPAAAESAGEDEFVPYPEPYDDDSEPRRRSLVLTMLIVLLVVIALAAAFWFLAPADLKAKLGLVAAASSPLELLTTHMDRQKLESGNELLTVSGRVINPTAKEQDVPPLHAQLRTRAGKVVYSWTIAPPARSLSPGSSATFNSAEVNVPPGGEELTITVGPARA